LYGLKQLKSKEESKFNANKTKFLSFIRNTDPDVLCVQENNLFSDAMITQSEVFPYSHYIVQHGAAIYSKHPIMDKGSIEFGTKTNSCLWVDVLIHGKKIRLYSVHLQSNRVSKDLEKITDNQDENSSEQISILRRIFTNYKRMAVVRAEQAEIIRDHAMRSSSPVILCGDLNDTPFSYPYDVFSQRYKDSFLESGIGLGPTYHGVLPGLRIDYVFADKRKFEFCFHRVLQTPFSDHSPVSVKMYGR
jgi:endonuclease/exonuclease/phosphatase family metal-dependent hydrolase